MERLRETGVDSSQAKAEDVEKFCATPISGAIVRVQQLRTFAIPHKRHASSFWQCPPSGLAIKHLILPSVPVEVMIRPEVIRMVDRLAPGSARGAHVEYDLESMSGALLPVAQEADSLLRTGDRVWVLLTKRSVFVAQL